VKALGSVIDIPENQMLNGLEIKMINRFKNLMKSDLQRNLKTIETKLEKDGLIDFYRAADPMSYDSEYDPVVFDDVKWLVSTMRRLVDSIDVKESKNETE